MSVVATAAPTEPGTFIETNPFRSSSSTRRSSSVRYPSSRPPRPTQKRSLSFTPSENGPRHRGQKVSAIPGADTIDRLGAIGDFAYHHDGPYDATLLARQFHGYSPVEALRDSNEKAIRATPKANIVDCLEKHYPMQGTAVFPPGYNGMEDYEEYDIQRLEGGYRRWPHLDYRDEDLKGKGEPSYSIEEFEKQQKASRRRAKTVSQQDNVRSSGMGYSTKEDSSIQMVEFPKSGGLGRSSSSAGRMEGLGGRLRRTFSLKKRK